MVAEVEASELDVAQHDASVKLTVLGKRKFSVDNVGDNTARTPLQHQHCGSPVSQEAVGDCPSSPQTPEHPPTPFPAWQHSPITSQPLQSIQRSYWSNITHVPTQHSKLYHISSPRPLPVTDSKPSIQYHQPHHLSHDLAGSVSRQACATLYDVSHGSDSFQAMSNPQSRTHISSDTQTGPANLPQLNNQLQLQNSSCSPLLPTVLVLIRTMAWMSQQESASKRLVIDSQPIDSDPEFLFFCEDIATMTQMDVCAPATSGPFMFCPTGAMSC